MKTIPILCTLASACCLISSCTIQRQTPFREADFANANRKGTGTVYGKAWTELKDHSIHYAESVDLAPVNAYTTEIVQQLVENGRHLTPADPRYDKYVRSVWTDKNGNFVFHNIPAGEYYIAAKAYYKHRVDNTDAEGIMYSYDVKRSQWIYHRFKMDEGDNIQITGWNQASAQSEE